MGYRSRYVRMCYLTAVKKINKKLDSGELMPSFLKLCVFENSGSHLFGATILAPPISLPYAFCTDRFHANSVLFDSSLI